MAEYDKTKYILGKIIQYCEEINILTKRFGESLDAFKTDFAYRHACGMCIFQIGELASRLDDDFRAKYDGVPWKSIRGMRNIVAHEYENLNYDEAWAAIDMRVPELKMYCEHILQEIARNENERQA